MYVGARYPDILFHFKIFTPLHHLRHLIETHYDQVLVARILPASPLAVPYLSS
jgi:hypothetical protein